MISFAVKKINHDEKTAKVIHDCGPSFPRGPRGVCLRAPLLFTAERITHDADAYNQVHLHTGGVG